MKPLNIFVIGSGMYVCGRGTAEYGTIMPAICEWSKKNCLGRVTIIGKSHQGIKAAKVKIKKLKKLMGVNFDTFYFQSGSNVSLKDYNKILLKSRNHSCAIIAVPDNLHKQIAVSTISGGLHTLVVKPLVSTVKEVKSLVGLQKTKDVYCAVEFHKRLDGANLKLKDIVSHGSMGDPLYFLVEYSQRKTIPTKYFKKWVETTNVFQYLGIHYVDIVYFVTGAIPKRAMAIGQKNWLISKGIDSYDSIQGIIEWELPSGKRFVSCILTNWIDPENTSAMSDQKIKVIGTEGRFESDQKRRGITIVADRMAMEEPNPYFCSGFGAPGNVTYQGYGIDSIHQFLNDVIRIEKGEIKVSALENKRPTFKQSMVPTAVLEAINKSLKNNGKWITIQGD